MHLESCPPADKVKAEQLETDFIGVGGVFVLRPLSGFVLRTTIAGYLTTEIVPKLLRDEWTLSPEQMKFRTTTGTRGTVTWVAGPHRVVKRYQSEDVSPTDTVLRVFERSFMSTSQSDQNELPRVEMIRYTVHDKTTGRLNQRMEIKYGEYSMNVPSDAEFQFSHYGLPEPPWLTPTTPASTPIPIAYYGVIIGLLLIVICIVLTRRRATA
jgi:hypothetical protein